MAKDKTPVYTCKKCGAKHGGSMSASLCPDCFAKDQKSGGRVK